MADPEIKTDSTALETISVQIAAVPEATPTEEQSEQTQAPVIDVQIAAVPEATPTKEQPKTPVIVPQKGRKTPRYRKTKQYHLYTPEQKATIAKYAAEHGNTKASTRFTKELGIIVPESTIRTFKKAYYAKLSEGKQPDEITEIPLRRRGRPRKLDGDTKTVKATPIKASGSKAEVMQIADTPGFLEMTGDISMSTISVSLSISNLKGIMISFLLPI